MGVNKWNEKYDTAVPEELSERGKSLGWLTDCSRQLCCGYRLLNDVQAFIRKHLVLARLLLKTCSHRSDRSELNWNSSEQGNGVNMVNAANCQLVQFSSIAATKTALRYSIRYGRFTCAPKLTRWPAQSSARHRDGKIRKN